MSKCNVAPEIPQAMTYTYGSIYGLILIGVSIWAFEATRKKTEQWKLKANGEVEIINNKKETVCIKIHINTHYVLRYFIIKQKKGLLLSLR